ncbi:winged helix-turn-helix transcriptional regulator [Kaarinaea lacus]
MVYPFDPNNHAKHIYSLTPAGIELLPILVEMINWALKHNTATRVPPEFHNGMRAGKDSFVKELI